MKVLVPDGFPRGGLPDDVEFAAEGAEFAVPTSSAMAERLADLPELRVVQVLSAGVDWVQPHVPDGVTLCNGGDTREAEAAAQALARAQVLRHRAGLPLRHVVSGPARPGR